MPIKIESQDGWLELASIPGPVVDPMILRCGELFLRGEAGVERPEDAWGLLTTNIHALGTFFDRVVLDQTIPVFNYDETFDIHRNFDSRTFSQVNAKDEILLDVDVGYNAYHQVKNAAEVELRKLFEPGGGGITQSEAESVLSELSASGYAWHPTLSDDLGGTDDERRLASFLLGGLIIGAYAQQAGKDHLMQPKRSRLFLALSLGHSTVHAPESYLFESLRELAGCSVVDLPYTPTFLPLLLAQSAGPAEMLSNALKLRESGEVRDYREWLSAALFEFDTNGRVPLSLTKEVKQIAERTRMRMAGLPLPEITVQMTVADVAAGHPPGVGANFTAPAKAIWGWVVEQLPGKRHRKLLSRAVVAEREYILLGRRIRTVWAGAGLPS